MKRTYIKPSIEKIILDKEISLQLASNPTPGPETGGSLAPNSRYDVYQYEEW